MEDLFLIAGLGNPGGKYENTRHNVGFHTIDYLSEKHNIKLSKIGFKAVYGEGAIDGTRVILLKPQTFMNLSGESVREIAAWYKMPLERVIVIYDDIDLEPGKIRVRPKGSSGTHNGMKSIIYHLQSEQFPRVRIGIGHPPEKWDLADYVLSKFTREEWGIIFDSIEKAAEAAIMITKSGPEKAMNCYNK
ncbi:PTH1 family peptidyl-tRNA hydrolase [Ruminiclostridium sufflavum DSM 19573]|uniref:Peptidyl-tRNA hydrolase n=1 Tax=Ruminiclostridium sufflavum DSM 19573 TaxID=1121337 RepID=A0A318XL75_9FIRM|nr:aminoacyl-tRNA hydrolase [Ruminiclostridium sufflavum]PYG88268.1 PTH1 family peptidyl-tRNA hydrolase [Ruminiclostridium sufflavum DSM 19573]